MTNTRGKIVGFDFKMAGNDLGRVIIAHNDAIVGSYLRPNGRLGDHGSWVQMDTLGTRGALTGERLGCHDTRHTGLIGGGRCAPTAKITMVLLVFDYVSSNLGEKASCFREFPGNYWGIV